MPEERDQSPEELESAAAGTVADAEAAAAAAQARADAARARAAELRREAEKLSAAAAPVAVQPDVPAQPAGAAQPTVTTTPARRLRRPKSVWPIAVAAGLVLLCALLGFSAFIIHKHRATEQDQQHAAEYAAAARQGVVNLMAINFNTAEGDVQRVLDNSTGTFKTQFQDTSKDLIKALKDAKVVTEVNVNSTAVESMKQDGAVVLVAATSQRGNADSANRDPRTWRAVVTIARENGQLKVSQLDFL